MWPWERMAMRGEAVPDGLDLADQMAYTCLRNIYYLYRERAITREKAAAEKRLLRREWEKARESMQFAERSGRYHVDLLQRTEAARTACRKNPTPENALALCNTLDGIDRRGSDGRT